MTWEESLIDETVGHYRLVKRLGAGGMGAVFLAEHPTVESQVAIKILHEAHMTDPALVRRLVDEARAVNMVRHPGLVRIHDCDTQEGVGLYLIMEYLRGQTLFQRFEDRGIFMPYFTARLLRQAASALAAAHAAGIIHRDLKPSNVFLVDDPEAMDGLRVKVLDFGVAKLLGDDEAMGELTSTGMIIGSPQYMSPEQCLDSKGVDPRTDVFSLAAMGYALLTGRLPFPGQNVGQVLMSHRRGGPEPMRAQRSKIPRELEQCLMSALALEREQRLGSMAEMEQLLEAVVEQGRVSGAAEAEAAVRDWRVGSAASGTMLDPDASGGDQEQPGLSTIGLLDAMPADEGTLIHEGDLEDLVSNRDGGDSAVAADDGADAGLHDAATIMLDSDASAAADSEMYEQPTVMLSQRTGAAAVLLESETIVDPGAVLGDDEPEDDLDQAALETYRVVPDEHERDSEADEKLPMSWLTPGVVVGVIVALAAVGAALIFLA